MGQQQLLLVILVTIIVGIATVVAINTFGSASSNANLSAVRNDAAQIASAVQGQYAKPTALSGAGQDFGNVSFDGMAFSGKQPSSGSGLTAVNQNGTYVLSGGSSTSITLTCYPSSDPGYTGSPDDPSTAAVDPTAGTSGGSMTYTIYKNRLNQDTPYSAGTAPAG